MKGSVTCVAIALAWCACAAPANEAPTRPRLVQSVDLHVPVAPIPVQVAGKPHLAYELHVANFRPVEATLTRVAVFDAGHGTLLLDLRDAKLSGSMGRPGVSATAADKRVLGPGMHGVVYFWVPLDASAPLPAKLKHRVEVDLPRSNGVEHVVVETAALDVSKAKPAALGPPLRGGPWVALYDPAMVGGHRTSIYTLEGRARIPARFAIDWVRLEQDASRARGDASQIANWHGYGAEVLAVADAVVAETADDLTEAPSLDDAHGLMPLENASGNYITLDLGGGRFAFYEHLKHGSIRVKRGDRVKRGQVIALLGNSGSSSSGPHLHFHVADASAELAAEGLPYLFDSFEVIGGFSSIDAFASGQRWDEAPPGASGQRKQELPAANSVVVFR